MSKQIIETDRAPQAIGTYSQAVRVGDLLFVSGQIPLDPDTNKLVAGGIVEQTTQVFSNIKAIATAAGTDLDSCTKVNISMIDLSGFAEVNRIMAELFKQPYPARACVAVAALPKDALIEIETIFYLPQNRAQLVD